MLAPAMSYEDKRRQRLQLLDDHIGRALRRSEANGELQSAPSWGKSLDFGDGYDETPPELRMGYEILKDAGVLPPEVESLRILAGLRQELDAAAGDDERERSLRRRIAALQLSIEMRRDAMRRDARRARERESGIAAGRAAASEHTSGRRCARVAGTGHNLSSADGCCRTADRLARWPPEPAHCTKSA